MDYDYAITTQLVIKFFKQNGNIVKKLQTTKEEFTTQKQAIQLLDISIVKKLFFFLQFYETKKRTNISFKFTRSKVKHIAYN